MARYELQGDENEAVLVLTGSFTVDKAELLKAAFLEALTFSRNVRLDLRELEEVDLAALQLFCSARKSFVQSERILSLPAELPASFQEAAERAGFGVSFLQDNGSAKGN